MTTEDNVGGEWVEAGDWDPYVKQLWKEKPQLLLSQGLEQAKITSENHKVAHGFRNTTADYNNYSGRARDAERDGTRFWQLSRQGRLDERDINNCGRMSGWCSALGRW